MTSRTPAQITSDILAKLAVTLPELSIEIGTPQRKMIDAFAESISEVQVDNNLVSTQLDIDTKSGKDLEDFVGIFGFGRFQGKAAVGSVQLGLSAPATQPILIPSGSTFQRSNDGVSYTSLQDVTIAISATTASIPCRCTVIGSVGNSSPNTITVFSAGLGISSITNPLAFTGGTDDETDEALRSRFKKTILRNIAGTEDFYIGISLQADGVNRVKVVGPISTYDTQVQVATGTNVLPAKNAKYIWSKGTAVAENKGTSGETWYTEGVEYSVTSGALTFPTLTADVSLNTKFLDISYEYTSSKSRNDPTTGITNKVDVFVDGTFPVAISEKLITKSNTVNSIGGDNWNVANFARTDGVALASGTSKIQQLGSQPVLIWPATLVVNSVTKTLGTDYVGVYSANNLRGSERERAGIVWITTAPADGFTFTANYTYNQIPQVLNAVFRRSKQITSDVLVRAAVISYVRFWFIIMYNAGSVPATVNTAAVAAIQAYLADLPFGTWIQLSDLVAVVHGVPGVDNVRMAKTADGGGAKTASEVTSAGTSITDYTADFQINEDSVAILYTPADLTTMFIRKAYTNFGS